MPKESTNYNAWPFQQNIESIPTVCAAEQADEDARSPQSLATESKMKRPPGNLGSLFFQGRIVLTEIKPSKLSGEIL
jgi:hypothetical protein